MATYHGVGELVVDMRVGEEGQGGGGGELGRQSASR